MSSRPKPRVPGVGEPLSIERYKLKMQSLEVRITERLNRVSNLSNPLCSKCFVVGERLQSTIDNFSVEPNPGNTASRDSTTNIFLGTLLEIFVQEDCQLCCLIAKHFLRSKRREIYDKICSAELQLDDMLVAEIGMLACFVKDDFEDSIQEPYSTCIQISVETLAVDRTLSLWWPEAFTEEVNDEPTQLPMIAEDHRALFGEAEPWVLLPKLAPYRGRDIAMHHDCFKTCMSKHESCVQPPSVAPPARLIDIESMRICRPEIGKNPAYIALSYVWGRSPFLVLKKSNESVLAQPGSLSIQDLPKTISDAIIVTRTFGYRYLWVDALCIMQDDWEDKSREIAIMHSIYAGADLTIVAAAGDDSNAGLLAMNSPFLEEQPHFITGQRFTLDRREMREVVEFSTWFTRGWTFQELVFSNRILYFTSERTYFCCNVGNWSEDCLFDESVSPKVYADYDDDPKLGFDFSNKLDPFENYTSMVENISWRDFTNEADILDACEGFWEGLLSSKLGSAMCGLPATCFEFALAWQPDRNLPRRNASEVPLKTPPSWSWAGWVGRITYPFLSGPQKMEIERSTQWTLWSNLSERSHVFTYCISEENAGVLHQILPADSISPVDNKWTQWPDTQHDLSKDRCWTSGSESFRVNVSGAYPTRMMRRHYIHSGLLFFKAKSIICSIRETDSPKLAERRNLRYFSINFNGPMIGELKIDAASLESLEAHCQSDYMDSIELISLFEMDFGSESMKNLLWMDSMSWRGNFGKDFSDMISGREDKNMHVVMWIRWDGDVAYRVAVGYVLTRSFELAHPQEKELVLG
jgi:hypothetical protein